MNGAQLLCAVRSRGGGPQSHLAVCQKDQSVPTGVLRRVQTAQKTSVPVISEDAVPRAGVQPSLPVRDDAADITRRQAQRAQLGACQLLPGGIELLHIGPGRLAVPGGDGGPEPDRSLLSGPAAGRHDVSVRSIEKVKGPVSLHPSKGRSAGLPLKEGCAAEEDGDRLPSGSLCFAFLDGVPHQIDVPAAETGRLEIAGIKLHFGKFRHIDHAGGSLHLQRVRHRLRRLAAGGEAQQQKQTQYPIFALHVFSPSFLL